MQRRLIVTVVALVVIASAAWLAVTTAPHRDGEQYAPSPSRSSISKSLPTSSSAVAPSTTAGRGTTSTTAGPANATVLTLGASGPEVEAIQSRLRGLGYWLAAVTGTFDDTTAHAVVAFQKANGLERDGVVGPLTRAALARSTRLTPRSTAGHVMEIDLERQLLLDVTAGRVVWVFDTSTGAVAGTTPVGLFRVEWQIDGLVHSRLGWLYRPKYFHDGVAIHGNPSVPPYPASHGCVRVVDAAIDWMWDNDVLPIGTPVWVY